MRRRSGFAYSPSTYSGITLPFRMTPRDSGRRIMGQRYCSSSRRTGYSVLKIGIGGLSSTKYAARPSKDVFWTKIARPMLVIGDIHEDCWLKELLEMFRRDRLAYPRARLGGCGEGIKSSPKCVHAFGEISSHSPTIAATLRRPMAATMLPWCDIAVRLGPECGQHNGIASPRPVERVLGSRPPFWLIFGRRCNAWSASI